MIDDRFANRTRLTHRRFDMHEKARTGVHFDHSTTCFIQGAADIFRHDIDTRNV